MQRWLPLFLSVRRDGWGPLEDYKAFRATVAASALPKFAPSSNEQAVLFSHQELQRLAGKRVLFVLPVGEPGGGANVIFNEAACLRRFGVDAWLGNFRSCRSAFEAMKSGVDVPALYFEKFSHVLALAGDFDAVVATAWWSTEVLRVLIEAKRQPVLGYYVQDYEPYFYDVGSNERALAQQSYHLSPAVKLFTKTVWNQQEVLRHEAIEPRVVGPSFDARLFNMIGRSPAGAAIRVCSMVRPSTPRRSPQLTMRVLKRLKHRFGSALHVAVFGCSATESGYRELDRDFEFEHVGVLDSPGMAALLRRSDVFLDLSTFQAMGLTALEAMACGAVVVGPLVGGVPEIIRHGVSGLLVDTQDEEACIRAAASLIEQPSLLERLQRGLPDMRPFAAEHAASRIARLLFLEN